MKLVHPEHGETHTESPQTINRLKNYGWRKATPEPKKAEEQQPLLNWDDVVEPEDD